MKILIAGIIIFLSFFPLTVLAVADATLGSECVVPAGEGSTPGQCLPGLFCLPDNEELELGGICAKKLADGGACAKEYYCTSGVCTAGYCGTTQPTLPAAGTAGAHPEAKALNAAIASIDKNFPDIVKDDNITALTGKLIKGLLGIIGTASLLVFIYSGIMWMLAGGKDEEIKKARNSMVWAALGLFAVFMSYTLLRYLISAIVF
ncbi:pilin [Patescibacteria group bacterium]|nr:pilin [Patescibacteria group bacterium]